MQQKRRWGFRIDTQSPGFEKWVTRIWVIAVLVLVATGCWYGRKAYVGYHQQQQAAAPEAQQAAAPEAQQVEALPEIEIPEIEPGNMRSVIAHNQAVRVAESLQRGGPGNMRKQLAEGSAIDSQQDVTQSGGVNMREVLKSQKGSVAQDGKLDGQTKDTEKKSPGEIAKEVASIVGVLFVFAGLILLCLREDTREWARPVTVFVSGFVGGYLFFIHCIWMSIKPGIVFGLMVGIAFLWFYCGWGQPAETRRRGGENFIDGVKGQGNRLAERFNRWREGRAGGQNQNQPRPPQPPLVPDGDQGGDQ